MTRAAASGGYKPDPEGEVAMLLEAGAIAYWTMSTDQTPHTVRDAVRSVTQCILRVDRRSVRVLKAEGRGEGVTGSVIHWHDEQGTATMEPANVIGRVRARRTGAFAGDDRPSFERARRDD